MRITKQSRAYSPSLVAARYVRRETTSNEYLFSEVDEAGFSLRQGSLEASELPHEIRMLADAERYSSIGDVPLPLEAYYQLHITNSVDDKTICERSS